MPPLSMLDQAIAAPTVPRNQMRRGLGRVEDDLLCARFGRGAPPPNPSGDLRARTPGARGRRRTGPDSQFQSDPGSE